MSGLRRGWENNIRIDLKSGSGSGLLAASCGHGNEPSGSIKRRTFFGYLSDCWLLKKDSAPCG